MVLRECSWKAEQGQVKRESQPWRKNTEAGTHVEGYPLRWGLLGVFAEHLQGQCGQSSRRGHESHARKGRQVGSAGLHGPHRPWVAFRLKSKTLCFANFKTRPCLQTDRRLWVGEERPILPLSL